MQVMHTTIRALTIVLQQWRNQLPAIRPLASECDRGAKPFPDQLSCRPCPQAGQLDQLPECRPGIADPVCTTRCLPYHMALVCSTRKA